MRATSPGARSVPWIVDWKKLLIVLCSVAGLAGGAGSSAATPAAVPGPPPAAEPAPSADLGQDFTLSTGQTADVATRDLTVRFSGLVSDSRCRPGMQCFWAGDATVSVVLAEPGRGERTGFELHTNSQGGHRDATFNAFRVDLVAVNQQGDEITLKVSHL
ncbi:hypothetical protein [Amycolatopsis sp. H20-H5]|uniref:hypothetical protein n=1 Tax=Amycolatopsis sp. H20-H5 TaxID=3046309 RepID=UPI002DB91D88|nr:hypothetical protein [Amycolatopsis sp. H20-H5]MEC3981976.1 hypothetical protein [Amycolatopsis sp. H20-H5]